MRGVAPLVLLALVGFAGPVRAQTLPDDGLSLVEAVRVTLVRDLVIRQQDAVVAGREGTLLRARSAFETRLATAVTHDRERAPLTALQRTQYEGITETITDATAYQVSLQRQFRTGLVVRPSLTVTRSHLDVDGVLLGAETPTFPSNNLARFEVLLTQPLLKGRGVAAGAADVRAAGLGIAASERRRDRVAEGQVLATVLAYWEYVAALRRHAVVAASKARAAQLLEDTERLVAADRRPRAALDQLRADRADKAAARLLAEQAVSTARHALGRAMGLTHTESRHLPAPTTDFSVLPSAAVLAAADSAALLDAALTHRTDLVAQRHAREAARVLARAADHDRRHRLDFSLGLGYTGLDDGAALEQFFTPVASNIGGLNVSAAFRYELPVNNRQARGAAAEAAAGYTAATLREADLRRRIEMDVHLALQQLAANGAALSLIEEAVDHHRQALANERARFEQGFSTLFNVILFQDRLTMAENNRITAQMHVAASLARLRFEAGLLLVEPAPAALSPAPFVTLPDVR